MIKLRILRMVLIYKFTIYFFKGIDSAEAPIETILASESIGYNVTVSFSFSCNNETQSMQIVLTHRLP